MNLTTNPLVNAGGGPSVVRYVTPQKGLRLHLKTDRQVSGVQSQIGSEVSHRTTAEGVEIDLPLLDLYDSLLVDYI